MRGRAEVARRAHNPEVVGSNPAPATKSDRQVAKATCFFIPAARCELAHIRVAGIKRADPSAGCLSDLSKALPLDRDRMGAI